MITIKNGFIIEDEQLVQKDIYIENGIIKKIDFNLEEKGKIVDAKGGFIMPGGTDVHVHLREPGFSHKETIRTGTMAALKGGITVCLAMPNIKPCPDSAIHLSVEQDIIDEDAVVHVFPYGAVTVGQKGKKLADIEMLKHSCIGFTDDGVGVNNIDLLVQAMRIANEHNLIIASHAEDLVNSKLPEGEYVAVRREIELAKEIGCRYHFCHLSTKESFDAVREAHKLGFTNITCEVSPHHLILNETMIKDANWKMNPPLRSEENRLETVKALLDGTASMVASDHAPHAVYEKNKEYAACPNGILGLETMIPIVYTHIIKPGHAKISNLIKWFVDEPNRVFGLPKKKIAVGYPGDLTVLDLDNKRVYTEDEILSISKNSPYIGMEFYGFPIYTIINGEILYKA